MILKKSWGQKGGPGAPLDPLLPPMTITSPWMLPPPMSVTFPYYLRSNSQKNDEQKLTTEQSKRQSNECSSLSWSVTLLWSQRPVRPSLQSERQHWVGPPNQTRTSFAFVKFRMKSLFRGFIAPKWVSANETSCRWF